MENINTRNKKNKGSKINEPNNSQKKRLVDYQNELQPDDGTKTEHKKRIS